MIFNMNSPNKMFPKPSEFKDVIELLKQISKNITLLDPLDLDPQKSNSISEFKDKMIKTMRTITSDFNQEELKRILKQDI